MKNLKLTILFLFSFSMYVFTQSNYSVSGIITESNGKGIPFVNVLLLKSSDSILVKGVITSENGMYTLNNITKGNYLIMSSSVGHQNAYSKPFYLDTNYKVEPLALTEGEALNEVQVVAKKQLYEQKSDRLIVNVASLPAFSGNSALQVLQKAPGVIVQENSNSISLNNKGEVLIMINDRVSRVPRSTLVQQLKGMRAENIDRIEIIHQPSAKHDANNAAGIIHIILKENTTDGLNGNISLTAGIGQKEKINGSADFNYRNKRFNLYGNVNGFQSRSPMWKINHFREYEYQGDQYNYENKLVFTNPTSNSVGFTLGTDFEIDKNKIIGAVFGYTKSNMSGHDYTSKSKGTINGETDSESQFLLDIENPNVSTFVNINYFWQLTPASSLNFDVDRVSLDVQNSSLLSYFEVQDDIDKAMSDRDSKFEIYTIKGDFEWKTNKGTKLETGLKGTFNNSNTIFSQSNRSSNIWVDDISNSLNDDINEKILAAYGSIQKKWNKKWESNLGMRLEHYNYKLDDTSGDNNFTISYNNVFPVVRTSYTIDSTRTLNLSFNRRIERPSFMNLAGFNLLIDPSLTVASNTRIRPSFTNTGRLAYNHGSFLLSFEINRTKGAIAFYNTVNKERGLQTSTPINFDSMNGYLLSLSFPIKIGQFWKMNWNIDGAYKKVNDKSNRPLPFEKDQFTVTAQLSNIFELGNSWTGNVDGRYMSPFISGDQILHLRHYINIGIKKKFSNQSSLTFSIQDLTATSGSIDWEYHQPELGIKTYGDNDMSERVFQVTYSFPFGNQKIKEKRNRKIGAQEERDRM